MGITNGIKLTYTSPNRMKCESCGSENIVPEDVDGQTVLRCEKCGRAVATGDTDIQKAKEIIDGYEKSSREE